MPLKNKKTINKAKTAYDLIKKQIFLIYNNFTKIDEIKDCSVPDIPAFSLDRRIGRTRSISAKNYDSDYFEIAEKGIPFIINKDDSMICIFFLFNERGEVIKNSMSYIPFERHECYFRIDYEPILDDNSSYHPESHMHISVDGDFCRIPLNFICTPFDFLYFVYKYIYKKEYSFLSNDVIYRKEFEIKINEEKIYFNHK